MDIELEKKDVKNSVFYRWHMCQFKVFLVVLLCVICLFTIGIILLINSAPLCDLSVWSCVGCSPFLAITLYFFIKAQVVLNNYKKYKCSIVKLDEVSESILFRRVSYFTVCAENTTLITNRLFSNYGFGYYRIDDFFNKNVLGLVDLKHKKFYIIDIVEEGNSK